MSLRPFVFLTACLLGACERKDASADATLPDHAETRSSLRDEGKRPVVTRKEREGKVDAVEVIRRLAREVASDGSYGDLLERAEEAIQQADASEFEAIWKALDEVKVDVAINLRAKAIYRLAAKEDLALAGRIAREIMLPLYGEGDQLYILRQLLEYGQDGEKLASYLGFMRDATPEERQWLKEEYRSVGWILPEHLKQLTESGQRLNNEETRLILDTYAIPPFGEIQMLYVPTDPEVKEIYRNLWETVKAGERNGVFAKGAGDLFLNAAGIYNGDWYLEMVPLEKLESMLALEGGDRVIEGIILKDFDRHWTKEEIPKHWVPATFFTPNGVRHLPQERVSAAIAVWNKHSRDSAETWFTNHSQHLTLEQRDLALVEFTKNGHPSDPESKAKSKAWRDQISDPELRERTVREIDPGLLFQKR